MSNRTSKTRHGKSLGQRPVKYVAEPVGAGIYRYRGFRIYCPGDDCLVYGAIDLRPMCAIGGGLVAATKYLDTLLGDVLNN